MNKSAIKNFAVSARIKLITAIEQKAYELGITKTEIKDPEVYQDGFRINGQFFRKYQMKQRKKLLQKIKEQNFEQVIEEVAYTWFNRLIAIRFMEVNEYLPTGVRVLSSHDSEKVEPDAVTNVLDIAEELELDFEVVYRLQDENNSEELFKYTLVKQCNKLGEIMPMMFEQIEDYTELLLPDKLLAEGSVVRDLVTMIDEEDWKEQVEIIGWLYQYYISEKKDQVFADLKKNKKITKENIPAATQLFTPKWIVQYMVENSLGRLWLESHPDEDLQKEWKYYLEEAEQEPEPEVKEQLEKLKNKELSPEEIKVLDPAMGSGHILVYAFDVLYKIYQNAGYAEREIPQLIIEKNLYGLDIDDRAAQLAYFALIMKGRSYNRRFFRKKVKTNLISIKDSNGIPEEAIDYLLINNSSNLNEENSVQLVKDFLKIFHDAKNYGSLIDIDGIDFNYLEEQLENIRNFDQEVDLFAENFREILLEKFPLLIQQAKIMSTKYDAVITNPPYRSTSELDIKIVEWSKANYPSSKADLFAMFIEKGFKFAKPYGFNVMVTMQSWMFLSTYQKLRNRILEEKSILSLCHMDDNVMGIAFLTSSTVWRNIKIKGYKATYSFVELSDIVNDKPKEFPIMNDRYSVTSDENFRLIPGSPIAYWINNDVLKTFYTENYLSNIAEIVSGMTTGNNDKYLRLWHEVNFEKITIGQKNIKEINLNEKNWIPYNKGGAFRKWYGNNDYIVNWAESHNFNRAKTTMKHLYLQKCITWSDISRRSFAARYCDYGFMFDVKGSCAFPEQKYHLYLLAIFNASITPIYIEALNPTTTTQVGDIKRIPLVIPDEKTKQVIDELSRRNIEIAKNDWDNFESSWDFSSHPFLKHKENESFIKNVFNKYLDITIDAFNSLKRNEETLNKLIMEIYCIANEQTNNIEDKHIAVRKGNVLREVKSFISYSVGCMLGRYSLNQNGLMFAGGDFGKLNYVTFKADHDNVLPITDDEYFEDDIVGRFIDFVCITFSEETLEENLDFIADALTRKANETSRQRIRRYFLKEFYKDHLQTYQNRPIYWLFDSGKQDGFKALIYMHRYDSGTVARVRTDYLHTLQRKYEAEMARLDLIQEADVSTQEKTKAKKQKEKIQKQLLECQQYDQVIAHVAHQQIEIDLDDGVKVNYAKFQNIEVPQGEGRKPLKANLLAKI